MAGGMGVLVVSHNHGMQMPGSLVQLTSTQFGPVHMRSDMLFLRPDDVVALYYVPETCLFRTAGSPLQRVARAADGRIVSSLADRVPLKYATSSAWLRDTTVQVKLDHVSVCVCVSD